MKEISKRNLSGLYHKKENGVKRMSGHLDGDGPGRNHDNG